MSKNSILTQTQTPIKPSIAGTGIFAVDVIWSDDRSILPRRKAGGTCGNVFTILASWGWAAYPIARLLPSQTTEWLKQDLNRWGVRQDGLIEDPQGATPIVFEKVGVGGKISFSRRCPACGLLSRWHAPIRKDQAETWIAQDTLPKVDVFFMDQPSAGAVTLARHYAKQGAFIVFEPSVDQPQAPFRQALTIADLVKWSKDRLGNHPDLERLAQGVQIETLGDNGLKLRDRRFDPKQEWVRLPPVELTQPVVDATGCGDWCLAAILNAFTQSPDHPQTASFEVWRNAADQGQSWAARNCLYQGARGGMDQPDLPEAPVSKENLGNDCGFCGLPRTTNGQKRAVP